MPRDGSFSQALSHMVSRGGGVVYIPSPFLVTWRLVCFNCCVSFEMYVRVAIVARSIIRGLL